MKFRLSMLANVLVEGWFALRAKIAGYRALATPEEADQRLNKCEACEELLESRQCNLCGCFVDAKTMLATAQCPKGLWKRILIKTPRR